MGVSAGPGLTKLTPAPQKVFTSPAALQIEIANKRDLKNALKPVGRVPAPTDSSPFVAQTFIVSGGTYDFTGDQVQSFPDPPEEPHHPGEDGESVILKNLNLQIDLG